MHNNTTAFCPDHTYSGGCGLGARRTSSFWSHPLICRAREKDKLLRMRETESQLLRCSIAEGQLSSTASSTCWHCQVLLYFLFLVGIQVKGRACAPESKWTDSLTESFSFSGQTMYQDSFHLWRMGDGRPKDSPDCAECRNSLSSVK